MSAVFATDEMKPWLTSQKLKQLDSDWGLPDYGYRLSQDFEFREKCRPFTIPRFRLIWKFIFMFIRYTWTWIKYRIHGRKMFIDNFDLCPWKPIYGAPIGGIGCGTIGRGYRGEFCRFQLVPGMYTFETVGADQFIACIRRHGQTIYQQVLSVYGPPDNTLTAWQWKFPKEQALYHALYPRSWTVYEIVECNVTLVCRQISPIFPNDYKDTSLPTAVFVWTAFNRSNDPLDISITFTFKSGPRVRGDMGSPVRCTSFEHDGHENPYLKVAGVTLSRSLRGMPCTYGVAASCLEGTDVSYQLAFDPDSSGHGLWQDLLEDGRLESNERSSFEASANEDLACAVCASRIIPAGGSGQVEFCLAWDMPVIQFAHGVRKYYRRYTKFFGYGGKSAPLLVHYALNNYREWEKKIDAWQKPILNDSSLPSWYKSALFNELYYVSDGGTVWVHPTEQNDEPISNVPPIIKEIGHFAFLEGHEYRMYNTYDVHHYASFALIHLWPLLQLSVQYDIAKAIPKHQDDKVRFCMSGNIDVVKAPYCVPHDVGDPDDEPWERVNSYIIHPTQEWKDLNTKFVLQVYRDYIYSGNEQYLAHMYPYAKTIMEQCLRWDVDGDGVIENSSFADQTYDAWTMTGTSSYCGGLWLAAVKAFCMMADQLKKTADKQTFADILKRGKAAFERKLWTGEYYKFDDSHSRHHDSIMASQLDGHWYLRASDISDYEVFPRDHVVSSLKSIYRNNVLPFGNGTLGAINGARPKNGGKDTDGLQSEEFWTGICYALAACMIHEGLTEEGWQVAYGPYHTCWERYGLAFQTPEAYYDDRRYRSLGYMRPLSIWAIQGALDKIQRDQGNKGDV